MSGQQREICLNRMPTSYSLDTQLLKKGLFLQSNSWIWQLVRTAPLTSEASQSFRDQK